VPEPQPIQWAIEKLSSRHDRTAFDCGQEPLNDFLRKYASQNQKSGVGQTYVALRPGSKTVDGYYTVSSGSVQLPNLPEAIRKRLPRYPVPVAQIGRLAVSRPTQGKELGQMLLLDAMERIIRAADSIGIHAIEVRAKDRQAMTFYTRYGFVPLLDDPLHLYISIQTVRKLGLV
jgi:ribosomal protein S18 acetylase RimI-like enzyme